MKEEINDLMDEEMEEKIRNIIKEDEGEINEMAGWELSGNFSIGGSSGSKQHDKHELIIRVSSGITEKWGTKMKREKEMKTEYYHRYAKKERSLKLKRT